MLHLVATNLIIWIDAICKESVEEIIEHEKEQMIRSEFRLEREVVIFIVILLHYKLIICKCTLTSDR